MKSELGPLPEYVAQFRSFYVDDAVCVRLGHPGVQLIIETRYRADDHVERPWGGYNRVILGL